MGKRWCAACGELESSGAAECSKCQSRSFVYSESMVGTLRDLSQSEKTSNTKKSEKKEIKTASNQDSDNQSPAFLTNRVEIKPTRSDSARIAIQSARIVNAYGAYIQIVGIAVGILVIIGGCVIASSVHLAWIAFIALIIGLLDIAIFAVQGAIFRMFSNYVIARLEDS